MIGNLFLRSMWSWLMFECNDTDAGWEEFFSYEDASLQYQGCDTAEVNQWSPIVHLRWWSESHEV